MRKTAKFVAVASLAIGAISFIGNTSALAEDNISRQQGSQNQSGSTANQGQGAANSSSPDVVVIERDVIYGVVIPSNAAQAPQGFSKTELKDAPSIKQVLGQVTSSALQKGQSTKILDYLSSKDQQRLKDSFTKAGTTKLDQQLAQIDKAWQQKYKENFNAGQVANAFNQQFILAEGQISNPNMLSNWPVQQPDSSKQGTMGTPGETGGSQQFKDNSRSSTDWNKSDTSGKSDLSKRDYSKSDASAKSDWSKSKSDSARQGASGMAGDQGAAGAHAADRHAAVVVFPAEHNLPETYVSLVREGNNWRIDLPDTVDGQKLSSELANQISMISQNADQWPQDKNEAYRLVSHRVMMALYGQSQQGASDHMMHHGAGSDTK